MQHVFIIGSKSIGAYGGYETFVYKLTEYHQHNKNIKYHVVCKANGDGCMDDSKLPGTKKISDIEFIFQNAHCLKIHVPQIGAAQAIYYDIAAISTFIKYIKKNHIKHPIVYILTCRIGPFAAHFQKAIHKLGGKIYLNPDGHEWMRAKWSIAIRKYWKFSERLMIKHCDLAICDSKNIEKYIQKEYRQYKPKTTYISYGAETRKSELNDDDSEFNTWLKNKGLKNGDYYLVVGRFVPENNYETMICEFIHSNTKRDFALITGANEKFLEELKVRIGYDTDKRIKFVGTVYDQELLKKIRQNAYGYLHGHEVGGTNPSLLEALGSTDLNLILNVGFNREVAEEAVLYWNKDKGNLATLIDKADLMSEDERLSLGKKAKQRITETYSWQFIADEYEKVFEVKQFAADEYEKVFEVKQFERATIN